MTAGDVMSGTSVRAVIVAHGTLAAGMVSAVEQIAGRGDCLRALSNSGHGLAELQASLSALLDETGARVVFTDLPAGSCTMAGRRLLRDRPDITLVTGMNLPLVLDFVMHDQAEPADAARSALVRGQGALAVCGS
ncbi:MAG: hypothetical protein WCK74_07935 [Gemmatimonadaceae bacterium]